MNQGVELVLKRMDSHPEEFEVPFVYNRHGYRSNAKWEWLTDRIVQRAERPKHDDTIGHLSFLTNEEVQLIYGKLMLIQEGVFTRAVMHTIMNKPEEEEDTFSNTMATGSQAVSTSRTQNPQTWGAQLNTLHGSRTSPVNPIPTSTKISFDAAADAYEVTYPNGFSHTIPINDVEDAPDYLRSLINSILTKP